MCERCCGKCAWYSRMYYECQNDYQPQGDIIKNPDDGTECDLFDPVDDAFS